MKYPVYKPGAALQVNDGNGLNDWFNAQNPQGDFLDVNVWVALGDTRHAHHADAVGYWQEVQSQDISVWMSRATMLGMVRVLAQLKRDTKILMSAADAFAICGNYRAMPFVKWLPETANRTKQIDTVLANLVQNLPSRLWSDAYLAATTQSTGLRMVTFDKDFKRFNLDNLLLLGA